MASSLRLDSSEHACMHPLPEALIKVAISTYHTFGCVSLDGEKTIRNAYLPSSSSKPSPSWSTTTSPFFKRVPPTLEEL